MSQPIVVGFDGSDRSRDALALARELAAVLATNLIVVHAYTPEERLWAPGTAAARTEKELQDVAAAAEAELPDGPAHELRAIASASAAGALHAAAESDGAQLIVVGSSRHGRLGRAILGTVTQAVLDAAPCAVLVAPAGLADGTGVPLAKIGVGFDDTPEAHDALAVARRLAAGAGGTVSIVWAAHLVARALPHAFAGYLEPNYFENVRREIEERLERVADEVRGECPVRTEIASGDTVDALVERTAKLDLLVLGSRGYGPLKRVFLGSVSSAVVNRAHCPVLVVVRGADSLAGVSADAESSAAATT